MNAPSTTTMIYIFVAVFVVCVIVGISFVLDKSNNLSTPTNITRISNLQVPLFEKTLSAYFKPKESIVTQKVTENQKALVNFAPLTVMHPGYVGPTLNGVYKEEEAVSAALKAGARCFILPIDYHENTGLPKPAFPDAFEPCLLYRDEGGTVRSLNAGSIQKVSQTLSNLAFNNIIPLNKDPLLLILYFVKTPTPNTKEYLRFCSKVAKQLNPLLPFLLGQAPEGVYNRQGRQDELLYTPLTNLERRVVVFSNIDTSIFRNPKSVGIQAVPSTEDLDFMIHCRLFKKSDEEIGATVKVEQNQFARGYVERLSFYEIIPDNRMKDIVETNKIRWIVTIPKAAEIPEKKIMKTALEKFGVQSIGLNLFALEESQKEILDLWKSTGWIPKPEAIRFSRPDAFKPKMPSTKLNANQGQLSSPTM